MTKRLREMVGEVSTTAGTFSTASGELAATSDEAGKAVDEIARAVGDVAGGAEKQVRAVESVRETGDEVAVAARTGAGHADGTVRAAAHARTIAESGTAAARSATEAMDAVRVSAHDAAATIRELGERSGVVASSAYAAMTRSGRRVLHLIEGEVERGGGTASISLDDFDRRFGCSRRATRFGLKQLAPSAWDRAASRRSGSTMAGVPSLRTKLRGW